MRASDRRTFPGIPSTRIGLAERVVQKETGGLKPFPNNPRIHTRQQIAKLAKSISAGWTNPILTDEFDMILAGHGRWLAAKKLGLAQVPTLTISGLSESQKKAVVIADNRLAEDSTWDFGELCKHLYDLIEVEFDVELTGFSTGEVDLLIDGDTKGTIPSRDDELPDLPSGDPVSVPGDVWELGRHRLVCADCRTESSYEKCLQGDQARQVVTDPPYNVRIAGHAMGRGKVKHPDFAMASGEMTPAEFVRFLESCMAVVNGHVTDGSIHHYFMDWRHIPELTTAGANVHYEWKNLLVWVKSNAGQGSFYRSQHELVCVFKHGSAEHINNFGLGATGRYRTNVLQYPSVNSLHPSRRGDLALHPTVKPVALVADLIRDCSHRNGVILDPFGGSGTTLIAAERTGRAARLIEIEPRYVDLTIRRWEALTGKQAVHKFSGASFEEVTRQRQTPKPKAAIERVRVRR